MKKNISRDFFWNSLGVFCQSLISPLLLLIIAQINSTDDLGMFSVLFSLSVTLYLLNLWGGRTYQISDIKKKHGAEEFILSRVYLSILALIFTVIFSVISGYSPEKTTLFIILVLFKSLEALSDVFYGVLQTNKQLYKSGISLFAKFIFGALAFLIVNVITKNLILASLAIVIVNILVIAVYDIPNMMRAEKNKLLNFKLSLKSLKLLKKTWLVCLISVFSSLLLNIPRYIVDNYHTNESAFFGVVAMPITLVALLLSFIIQPKLVDISIMYAEKSYKKIRSIVRQILIVSSVIGLVILIAAFFIGLPVLQLIFKVPLDNFSQTSLMLLLLGGIFSAISAVYVTLLTIMRKLTGALISMTTCIIFAVITSTLFIPNAESGTLVAANIFAATNLFQMSLLYVFYNRSLKN